MDQTLITVLRYSITYYQNDLFICAQYANKHKATALHKAYWLPCLLFPCKLLCTVSFGIYVAYPLTIYKEELFKTTMET